ncbi:hypothetical protein BK133_26890 [Paenibacillus sp. FSL H8-0548]|uniref:hypothetical protein n=1 Tax=Paenibacillus sp. FSL H8-0548 TaxID=1920422 RepID=UPI00096E4E5F|nr:hypothetical protein [Paenibacillus sp. FSL H8-0548]OMF22195.1 hypothetical protein BK133_26890 [Paenibacillus sp. FSL H8-0548]
MNKWKVMLSVVVIAAALAGCGVQEEQTTAEGQTGTQGTAEQNGGAGTTQSNGAGRGMGMMGAQADLMGKVKSIDGQTITLYKSAMGQGGGMPPSGDGQQMPEGGEPSADGERPERPEVPAGDGTATEGDGTAPQGGGRMNMESMFTDETVDIEVTDTTKIVTMTFENEQMVEKAIALADLKTDDILSVMLVDGTQQAESITITTGGFGGGGGGRQPQQQTADK